jgi:outer membrane protein
MKTRIALICLAGIFLSTPVLAELKIGFVDVRAVLTESKAGIQHRADLEKYVKDKQTALKKEEEKLTALKTSLEKEALTLSDAQKQEKQRAFQEKVQAFQKQAQDADRELRQKDTEFTNKSIETIRQIVTEVAKAEQVNMVLSRTEIIYAETAMDLTDKVREKFNAASAKAGKK